MLIRVIISIFSFFAFAVTSCSQTGNTRIILGKSQAEQELKAALSDTTLHNVIDNKTAIIQDSLTAIAVAESVLFSTYGKKNIIKQRPYEIYFIDKYWVLSGTLPKNYLGGTFLIIINSLDGKILRLSHGK